MTNHLSKTFQLMDPYYFAFLGCAASIALSVFGAAWGIMLIGPALLGSSVKVSRVRTKNLISVIFCEAVAIYGLIIAIVFQNKLTPPKTTTFSATDYHAGYGMFWAGMQCGLVNMICAMAIGIIGSNAAMADAMEASIFFKMLVMEILASALGLFGVILAVIIFSSAQFSS